MAWTSKHQDFAAKNRWWQSGINVANHLYKKVGLEPVELEFDSYKFNNRMKKVRGRKYHRTTIPKAVKHLAENSQGLILILRNYGKGVFRLKVFPLSYLTENGNSSSDFSNSATAEKPLHSESFKTFQKENLQQQQEYINNIDTLLRKVGLKFDCDSLNNIYRMSGKSIERIMSAIELLLYRNSHKKVPGAHGFIIDCLRKRWADGFDIYYEPELPTFRTNSEIRDFTRNIRKSLPFWEKQANSQKKYEPRTI